MCWDLLQIFAYGTYADFIEHRQSFPQLSDAQLNKLRQLTLVTLASKMKHIKYTTLLAELGLVHVRQLEDLIIEAIYANVIQGKLDQKNQMLEVDSAMGRDVKPEEVDKMINTLANWCNG